MKALTVCEPYASLICLPDDDDRRKRVENRRWSWGYRGDLLIHAGKSVAFIDDEMSEAWPEGYELAKSDLVFGAILGVCRIVACPNMEDIRGPKVPDAMAWLRDHAHAEGPYCFVLEDVRRFAKPIPYRGQQGPFEIPDKLVAKAVAKARSQPQMAGPRHVKPPARERELLLFP